jgi:hypothetical protein
MKIKISLFLVCCLFIIVSSCKKEIGETESQLSPMNTLLQKMQLIEGTNGGLTISTGKIYSRYNTNLKRTFEITGGFQDLPFENIKVDGVNLVPLVKLEPGVKSPQYVMDKPYDNSMLQNLFGKKISISYETKSNILSSRSESSINTPNLLEIDIPANSSGGSNVPSNFYPNVPITWNAGYSGNVYILMAFDPQSVSNAQFRSYSRITKFYEVPDNGSFTLTQSNFQDIPKGAYVTILVARGETAIGAGSSNGSGTSIRAISTASLSAQTGGGGTGSGDGGPGIYVF